jgi:hypothetical protein
MFRQSDSRRPRASKIRARKLFFEGLEDRRVMAITDLDAANNLVAESALVNDAVGITASSNLGGTITYSLTDSANNAFKIDATTGVVSVDDASVLDGTNVVSITVKADSDGGSSETQSFNISVDNVAPTATSLTGPTTLAVLTSGTFTINGASDVSADLSTLRFSFATSMAGLAANYAAASTSNTASFSFTTAGAQTIYARVYDKDGGTSTVFTLPVSIESTSAEMVGSDLVMIDKAGLNNKYAVQLDGTDIVVTHAAGDLGTFNSAPVGWTLFNGGKSIRIAAASFAGHIKINGGAGSDVLQVTGTLPANVVVDFDGGGGAGDHDSLVFSDASDVTITYAATHQYAGKFDGAISAGGTSRVTFAGLSPVNLTNIAGVLTFNLPTGSDQDAEIGISAGNITLTGSTFENTTVALADVTQVIVNGNGGNDKIKVASSYVGAVPVLDINTAGGTDVVTVSGNVRNVSTGAGADAIVVENTGTVSGTVNGGNNSGDALTVKKTGGATFNVTAANAGDATGVFAFTGIWSLTGDTGADVFNVDAALSGGISGMGGNDSFVIGNAGSVGGTIDGGSNTTGDTLTVKKAAGATFNVTAANAGNATGVFAFTGIENLTSDAGNDQFNVNAALSGNIAALGGNDSIVVGNAGSVGGTVDGGGNTTGDTLTVRKTAGATFNVTAANAGNATGVSAFTGFENLTGDTGADVFNVDATLSGSISGLGGNDSIVIGTAGSVGGTVDGGSNTTGDTLTVRRAAGATFNVTAANAGNVAGVVTFTGIENLTGDAGNDQFNVDAALSGNISALGGNDSIVVSNAGSVGGTVDGGGNITGDTLTVKKTAGAMFNVTAANAGNATGVFAFTAVENLTGDAGDDVFNVDAALSGNISALGGNDSIAVGNAGSVGGTVDGGGNATGDTLTVKIAAGATFSVTAANAGNATGVFAFTAIENLTGDAAGDIFNIDATLSGNITALGGNDSIIVGNAGSVSGTVDGGNDAGDTLTVKKAGGATFNVTAAHAGNATGVFAFTGIGNLTGDAGNDVFNVDAALSGNISGLGGNDSIVVGNAGSVGGTVDGGNDSDTLTVKKAAGATFNVTAANAGNATGVFAFTGIENVTGDAGADVFNIDAALSGDITALGGNDSIVVSNAGSVAGTVDGGNDSDTLTVKKAAGATFNVIAGNAGTATGVFALTGIENLTGDAGSDVFNVDAALSGNISGLGGNDSIVIGNAGSVGGTVDGGSNTTGDTLTVKKAAGAIFNVTAANTGNATGVFAFTGIENLTGDAGADVFNVDAALSGNISALGGNDSIVVGNAGSVGGTVDGGGNTTGDTLTVKKTGGATFNVTAANAGNATGVFAFAGIENLTGDAGADVFNVNATLSGNITALGGNDSIVVGNAGSVGGTVDGGGNGVAGDTLTVRKAAGATFNVTAANAGNSTGVVAFTGIENLTGDAGNDLFNVNAALSGDVSALGGDDSIVIGSGGSVVGKVDGGPHSLPQGDKLDVTALLTPTINLDVSLNVGNVVGAVGSFTNIETIDATQADYIFTSPTGSGVYINGFVAGKGGSGYTFDAATYTSTPLSPLPTAIVNILGVQNIITQATVGNRDVVWVDTSGQIDGTVTTAAGDDLVQVDGKLVGIITTNDGADNVLITGISGSIFTGADNDLVTVSGTIDDATKNQIDVGDSDATTGNIVTLNGAKAGGSKNLDVLGGAHRDTVNIGPLTTDIADLTIDTKLGTTDAINVIVGDVTLGGTATFTSATTNIDNGRTLSAAVIDIHGNLEFRGDGAVAATAGDVAVTGTMAVGGADAITASQGSITLSKQVTGGGSLTTSAGKDTTFEKKVDIGGDLISTIGSLLVQPAGTFAGTLTADESVKAKSITVKGDSNDKALFNSTVTSTNGSITIGTGATAATKLAFVQFNDNVSSSPATSDIIIWAGKTTLANGVVVTAGRNVTVNGNLEFAGDGEVNATTGSVGVTGTTAIGGDDLITAAQNIMLSGPVTGAGSLTTTSGKDTKFGSLVDLGGDFNATFGTLPAPVVGMLTAIGAVSAKSIVINGDSNDVAEFDSTVTAFDGDIVIGDYNAAAKTLVTVALLGDVEAKGTDVDVKIGAGETLLGGNVTAVRDVAIQGFGISPANGIVNVVATSGDLQIKATNGSVKLANVINQPANQAATTIDRLTISAAQDVTLSSVNLKAAPSSIAPLLSVLVDQVFGDFGKLLVTDTVTGLRAGGVEVKSNNGIEANYYVSAEGGLNSITFIVVNPYPTLPAAGTSYLHSQYELKLTGATFESDGLITLQSDGDLRVVNGSRLTAADVITIQSDASQHIYNTETGRLPFGSIIQIGAASSSDTTTIETTKNLIMRGRGRADWYVLDPAAIASVRNVNINARGGADRLKLMYRQNWQASAGPVSTVNVLGNGINMVVDIDADRDVAFARNLQFTYLAPVGLNPIVPGSGYAGVVGDDVEFRTSAVATNNTSQSFRFQDVAKYLVRAKAGSNSQATILGQLDRENFISVGNIITGAGGSDAGQTETLNDGTSRFRPRLLDVSGNIPAVTSVFPDTTLTDDFNRFGLAGVSIIHVAGGYRADDIRLDVDPRDMKVSGANSFIPVNGVPGVGSNGMVRTIIEGNGARGISSLGQGEVLQGNMQVPFSGNPKSAVSSGVSAILNYVFGAGFDSRTNTAVPLLGGAANTLTNVRIGIGTNSDYILAAYYMVTNASGVIQQPIGPVAGGGNHTYYATTGTPNDPTDRTGSAVIVGDVVSGTINFVGGEYSERIASGDSFASNYYGITKLDVIAWLKGVFPNSSKRNAVTGAANNAGSMVAKLADINFQFVTLGPGKLSPPRT